MTLRFLPDTPIRTAAEDLLQVSPFVNLLRRSLLRVEAPAVYGILGDWGTGKTSILRLLQGQLSVASSRENTFIPIWVDAHLYENGANVIYPILHAIRQQYEAAARGYGLSEPFMKKFDQVVGNSALALNQAGLQKMAQQFSDQALNQREVPEQREMTRQRSAARLSHLLGAWTTTVGQLGRQFGELLAAYADDVARWRQIDPASVRFIILVDDLDRCRPATSLSLLESINHHLSVERCVFILALNPQIIDQTIQAKYDGLAIGGRAYLETILTYAFPVPEPHPARVKAFTSTRLDVLVRDPEIQATYRPSFEEFGRVLAACRFSNPRHIKRILNRYLLFLSHYEQNGLLQLDDLNLNNIVRLLVMAEYFPALFDLLAGLPYPRQLIESHSTKTTYADWTHTYGVAIPDRYPPLTRLRELFNLTVTGSSPQMEIEAVGQIVGC